MKHKFQLHHFQGHPETSSYVSIANLHAGKKEDM